MGRIDLSSKRFRVELAGIEMCSFHDGKPERCTVTVDALSPSSCHAPTEGVAEDRAWVELKEEAPDALQSLFKTAERRLLNRRRSRISSEVYSPKDSSVRP